MTLAENVSMPTLDDAADPDKIISEVKDYVHSKRSHENSTPARWPLFQEEWNSETRPL